MHLAKSFDAFEKLKRCYRCCCCCQFFFLVDCNQVNQYKPANASQKWRVSETRSEDKYLKYFTVNVNCLYNRLGSFENTFPKLNTGILWTHWCNSVLIQYYLCNITILEFLVVDLAKLLSSRNYRNWTNTDNRDTSKAKSNHYYYHRAYLNLGR